MALLWTKLQDYLEISSEKIWQHLEMMYNLESLDDIESLPFPNDEKEFYLPEGDYGALKLKKEEVKQEEKISKPNSVKKEIKEMPKVTKEVKKLIEDKTPKKETPRRDSKDDKNDVKTPITAKKELKKEPEKMKSLKGKTPINKEERIRTPKTEERKVIKRPTRGSMKPDETSRKSQSPLTVTPSSTAKRRRI